MTARQESECLFPGTERCGTYVAYVTDRCRNEPCRTAHREYEQRRKQRRVPPYVGASRARAHLRTLAQAGIGLKSVARTTGISTGTLTKLVYGDYKTGRPPSKRIRRQTEQRILAVTVDDAPGGTREPAGPTWAIVDELVNRGWTKAAIGRRVTGPSAWSLQLGREYVTRSTARIIRGLLDEPVPPRRSRHGLHPVPQPDPDDPPHDDTPPPDRYELPRPPVVTGDDTWRQSAACRHDTIPNHLFFPGRGGNETSNAAKQVCARCPVVDECLDYALDAGEHYGIWGGTSERERRRLRRDRRSVA